MWNFKRTKLHFELGFQFIVHRIAFEDDDYAYFLLFSQTPSNPFKSTDRLGS
jgi:hypothetical protein